jgi:hypoxanthine-guanine phosphoribosyltransferase
MKGYEPWRIAALESVNPKIRFDNDVIHECVEALVSDILGDNMDLSTLHVYDDFTAINGAASIAYVEKINRNTSAGFPWRKSKKFFLKSVPPRYGLQDPVEPTPEIMERVNEMYHRYKSGQRVMPVFTAHLKDEAVSFKKIEAKKTRVFAGAPFDWTILVRKYFLSTIRLVQNNRYTFESGPGTVAQSYEWHEMYDHLTHFGSDRIVAGDYKAFDKSMSSVFILAAFRILIRINMASGNFTADDERVMWGIANDVAFPVMDFNGDFVQFFGSNPSGHPLTVIINGLVNSLYLRYVYYHLNPDHVVNTFRANVRLFTYGDDNIMGVSICAPWFNHSAIASVLDTCGIVYTMADKESKSVPYINMKDATFLKRSWSYDKDVGAYLAPLDHDSIERQMTVWVRSKSVSAQEQIIDIIAGVTREYFFYGRKTFERKQLMLKEIVAQTELEPWVVESTFPSWKSLHDEFWENSKRVGCLPPWREAEMQTHGFVDKSQPKATVLGSYCTDQLFHDTNVSECGSSMTSQGRSPNTLFSVGVCGAPEVFMELCESLSQPRNFNRLTNTKSTSGLSPKDNMDTLYDVHTVGDNTNVHTLDDFLDSTYTMQSLEEKITTSGENLNQQTIGFTDEVGGDNTSIPAPINYVMSAGAVNAELGDYLSRPTEIIRFTWAEAGTIGATFEPWELFFDQAAVRKKLDNFYLLQCNLKLKIVINASQFYYGALLASYQPLSLFNPAPIAASTGEEEMVLYSQRPHVDLYPQNCQGGELTLPFIYHREWLNITSRANLQDMGSLIFKSYTPLLNANGVVGTGCDVVVYAWAEDVRLCGPTVKLSLQSKTKDEYNDDGVISKPASAIAKATGDLGNIPVIGPFMTATSAVAGTVGKIANIFGFTNPPVLDDVHAFKSTAFPNLATTDIGVPYEKLTLDAKNELSIDPRICGADLGDEMQIHSFASRESFLRSLTWSTTSVRTVPLMTMRATPILARFTTQTGQKTLYKTPMMHIAQMFKYWRGDIKVRIKVICSPYHKGRLRISYDPIGDIDTNLTGDTQNQVYTEILDIADNTDCTFNIPYVQDLAYMETGPEASQGAYNNAAGTLTPTTNEGIVNGVITISPLTVLTSPVTPSEVRLLVYVSAGDNFELADPISIPGDYSYYTIQGDVSYTSAPEDVILIGGHTSTTDDNINLVYMGESVKSLRTLCHRGTLHSVMQEFAEVTPTYGVATYYHVIPRRPRFPGFDIDGGEFADTVLVAGTHPYNWVNWTAMTWLEPCFVGQRGSINWVSHPQQQRENRTSISLNREHTTLSTFDYYGFYEGANTRDSISREYIIQGTRTMEGAGVNSQGVQNTVHCVAPFYANVKFQTTSANARNRGIAADGSNKDAIRATAVFSPLNVEPNATASQASSGFTSFYVSSGVDYNLIFFLNVPVTYKYNFIPSAP